MEPVFTLKKVKPRALAFVDYEHWLISLNHKYHLKPNIGSWISELRSKVDLRDLYFFGDFSTPEMEQELFRIRSFTTKIVETKNAGIYKKDFTDFIMLDFIYQQEIALPDTEAYILFTGDAHFNSVTAFLKNIRGKQVGLYGVRGALSTQLKNTADWWAELPFEADLFREYFRMILSNLRHLEDRKDFPVKPTFMRTVQCTAEYNNVEEEMIKSALEQLMAAGYISQKEEYIGFHRTITALCVDWDAVKQDGLWKEPYYSQPLLSVT